MVRFLASLIGSTLNTLSGEPYFAERYMEPLKFPPEQILYPEKVFRVIEAKLKVNKNVFHFPF